MYNYIWEMVILFDPVNSLIPKYILISTQGQCGEILREFLAGVWRDEHILCILLPGKRALHKFEICLKPTSSKILLILQVLHFWNFLLFPSLHYVYFPAKAITAITNMADCALDPAEFPAAYRASNASIFDCAAYEENKTKHTFFKVR